MTIRHKKGETTDDDVHWSQRVTETSRALELEEGVFSLSDPREIALSLKRSADASRHRRSEPFRCAMSMLTFYLNRAGSRLSAQQRNRIEAARDELRELYGRPRRDEKVNARRANKSGPR